MGTSAYLFLLVNLWVAMFVNSDLKNNAASNCNTVFAAAAILAWIGHGVYLLFWGA